MDNHRPEEFDVATDLNRRSERNDVTTEFWALASLQLLLAIAMVPIDGFFGFARLIVGHLLFDLVVFFLLIAGERKYRTRGKTLLLVFLLVTPMLWCAFACFERVLSFY